MKILNQKQYDAAYEFEEIDYIIPCDNVGDCKFQKKINDETYIYAMSADATQFMLSTPERDTFFTDTTLDEVLVYLGT